MKINLSTTMAQLLERFPNGFAIAPDGHIFEVVAQTVKATRLPQLVTPGGYLAVAVPTLRVGDERFFLDIVDTQNVKPLGQIADELDELIAEMDTIEETKAALKAYKQYSKRVEAQNGTSSL